MAQPLKLKITTETLINKLRYHRGEETIHYMYYTAIWYENINNDTVALHTENKTIIITPQQLNTIIITIEHLSNTTIHTLSQQQQISTIFLARHTFYSILYPIQALLHNNPHIRKVAKIIKEQ